MSYLDITITPESGYTQTNIDQTYQAIATLLITHPAWTFVEDVDYISGPNTWRSHVWRCNAAQSGLPKDFYVSFRLQFTTATGLYPTSGPTNFQHYLFEDYDVPTHTASKIATRQTSGTFELQADLTHPMIWDLSTVNPTASEAFAHYGVFAKISAGTSYRLFTGVTNDGIFMATAIGVSVETMTNYVGAFETLLSAEDDPMPIMNYGSSQYSGAQGYDSAYTSSTRHPQAIPGPQTYLFGLQMAAYHVDSNQGNMSQFGGSPKMFPDTIGGVLGNPADKSWSKYLGGVFTYKTPLSTCGNGAGCSGSTKGGLRGWLKNELNANTTVCTPGDTFLIDGKAYMSLGYPYFGLWDTTS